MFFNCSKCKVDHYDVEMNELQKIYTSTVQSKSNLTQNVDLYIDYSTCVAEAVTNSPFFRAIRPRITGSGPTLFGIQGPMIRLISLNRDTVNQVLNNISEISFANIPGAIEQICNSNNQAILITDGEYWTTPEGERIDLPYMKDRFIKWLNKGYSINIASEAYVENYNGRPYDKKRFYFFFIDDNIQNNIFSEISKAENFYSSNVTFFKLTNSDLKIQRNSMIDSNLDSKSDTTYNFDYFEINTSWEDIFKYVLNATDDQGNTINNGNPLIYNIKIQNLELNNYNIDNVVIKAYNISSLYMDNAHSIKLNTEIPDGFSIINQNGKISIKLTPQIENYLDNSNDNLIRIDLILKDARSKGVPRELFSWHSLTNPGRENISVYESIRQTIDNRDTNPSTRNNGIIRTIFIKTPEFK